jgi:hypothetical protein
MGPVGRGAHLFREQSARRIDLVSLAARSTVSADDRGSTWRVQTPGEDPVVNGEYGFAFTKGFQEGDGDTTGESDAKEPLALTRSEFTTSYWKANVVAKHFVACTPPTTTVPSLASLLVTGWRVLLERLLLFVHLFVCLAV